MVKRKRSGHTKQQRNQRWKKRKRNPSKKSRRNGAVRRPFLLELMRHFGVGDGLTQWFSTLLTGTYTTASVNGHHSRLTELVGGIRQGGAESCDGYLFIPWALDCWLRRCLSVGVQATVGEEVRGWYYADDGHIVLKSLDPDVIASFKEAMEVFALATNQHLNYDKTKLLPLGDWPVGSVNYSQRIHGFEVVPIASSLGVSFSNEDEPPSPDWPRHIDKFEGKCQRIAKLGLSAFGRSFAVGTYGSSTLLHALEFADALPSNEAKRLTSCIRHLVDLNVGPRAQVSPHARMPGIHSQALFGPPAKGGFGLLPIQEHVNARWFMQARRFIHWSLGLGGSSFSPKSLVALRHRQALAAQARIPYVLTPEEQLLSRWKPQEPIWIQVASAILSKVGPAMPVETLISACGFPLASATQGRLGRTIIPPGPIRRWCSSLATLGVPSFVPNQGVSDPFRTLTIGRLQQGLRSPERTRTLLRELTLMYWASRGSTPPLTILGLASVRLATLTFLSPHFRWQRERRLENIHHALSLLPLPPNPEPPSAVLDALSTRMSKLWGVTQCANEWKEVAWRLQVNGVKAAGGHDIAQACACGFLRPPPFARAHRGTRLSPQEHMDKALHDKARALACKAHVFGTCPVAQAVLQVLREALPAPLSSLLQPADVWLLQLPQSDQPPAINREAWSLTCALALYAMDRGHAFLYSQRALDDVISRASNRAVAWFCYLLSDVASFGTVPHKWDLPPSQPFFRCTITPSSDTTLPASTRLEVNLPASLLALPIDT